MKKLILSICLTILFSFSSCITSISASDDVYMGKDNKVKFEIINDACYIYIENPSYAFLHQFYFIDNYYYYWDVTVQCYIPVIFPYWKEWCARYHFYNDHFYYERPHIYHGHRNDFHRYNRHNRPQEPRDRYHRPTEHNRHVPNNRPQHDNRISPQRHDSHREPNHNNRGNQHINQPQHQRMQPSRTMPMNNNNNVPRGGSHSNGGSRGNSGGRR